VEHLKQQAKDLLVSLREDDPSAVLSDAQRTLAQQYGFRTWTELKAEVERIRSTPETFDAHIAAQIAKAFELGELAEPPIVISLLDVGGPSLKLRTASGDWHVHGWLSTSDDARSEDAVRLMDAMRGAGFPVPIAKRGVSGSLLEEVGEHKWRADSWIDVGPTIVTPVSRAHARRAGELLATMHGLDVKPSLGMHPWLASKPRDEATWQRALEVLSENEVSWIDAFRGALPAILDISRAHLDPPADGLLLAHTDFQPASTHVGPGGALVPVGWDFTGAISREWHIGMVLDSWSALPDGGINEKAARAILEGYASVAGDVPALDVSSFSPVITAWQNWLVREMNVALGGSGRAQEIAARELPEMLAHPKDRSRFERVLRAAGVR
jgi:hypothetical protein